MPIHAALSSVWLPLYGLLASYFLVVYFRYAEDFQYLLFGLLCAGMGFTCMASAYLYASTNYEEGVARQAWQLAFSIPVIPLALHFAMRVTCIELPRILRLSYGVHTLGFLATVSGLCFDSSVPLVKVITILGRKEHYFESAFTPVGQFALMAIVLTLGFMLVILMVAVNRGDSAVRPFLFAVGMLFPIIVHDVMIASGLVRFMYLAEHAAVVVIVAMAYSLMILLQNDSRDLKLLEAEHANAKELAAVGELAGRIAHEVRNPLATIYAALAAMRKRVPSDEQVEMLMEILQDELDRLKRIVADLLRFAQPVELQAEGTTVEELLQEAVVGAQHTLSDDIAVPEVELSVGDIGAVEILVDPQVMHQAMVHLIENALVASSGRGSVRITAWLDEDHGLRVEVEDDGEGMDETALAKAFEPFFTTRPKGTGLGLPIVRRLVSAHAGSVRLELANGGGILATVLLPNAVS